MGCKHRLFLALGRSGRLPDTGTGAERRMGRHANELEKCLACLGCWGELGKVLLLEMRDLRPPISLPSSSVSLHLDFMVGKASGL